MTTTSEHPSTSLGGDLAALAGRLEHADSGTLAALRRLDPRSDHGWQTAAFYRLTADRNWPPQCERPWALVLGGMARIRHVARGPSFGRAMAEHQVSELRLARLLQADADQLPMQLRSIIHLLVSRGITRADWYPLTALTVYGAERARRSLARDYYTTASSSTSH